MLELSLQQAVYGLKDDGIEQRPGVTRVGTRRVFPAGHRQLVLKRYLRSLLSIDALTPEANSFWVPNYQSWD
jgi:hypothetical protein